MDTAVSHLPPLYGSKNRMPASEDRAVKPVFDSAAIHRILYEYDIEIEKLRDRRNALRDKYILKK